MATFKFTMLFSSLSAPSNPGAPVHRTGGWSESWYANAADVPTLLALAQNGVLNVGLGLLPNRAALLPAASSIIGFRAQQVVPPAAAQTGVLNLPGSSGLATGQPQQALLCRAPGQGVANIRRFMLRAIPASQIVEGEFQPQNPFQVQLNNFFQSLANWQFRARDLTQPTTRIVTITVAAGVATITFEANVNMPQNSFIRVLRSLDANKVLRGGRFQVATVVNPTTITISNWNFGPTTGGSARIDAITYPNVATATVGSSRIVTRRVGRPFVAYRGRRSKRR